MFLYLSIYDEHPIKDHEIVGDIHGEGINQKNES